MKIHSLVIDIGNTSTHFGIFLANLLLKDWRVETKQLLDYQEIITAEKVIAASVVPQASKIIKKFYPRAHFVNYQNIGLKIKVKNPAEVGADRLVDALAAIKLYGAPAIIIDFGTATTFDVVSAKGEYLGGAIAPGLSLSRDILHDRTAKLPRVEIKTPRQVVGKSTIEAMQSGLVFGYVAMVEGMIARIKSQFTNNKLPTNSKDKTQNAKFKVIATGGLAKLICQQTAIIDIIDDKLTLKGLQLIQEGII